MVAYQWSSRSPELPGVRTEDRDAWHVLVSAMVVPHQNKAFKHRFRLSHGSPCHAYGPSHANAPSDSPSPRRQRQARWDRPTDSRLHTSPARRSRPPRTAPLARVRAGRRGGRRTLAEPWAYPRPATRLLPPPSRRTTDVECALAGSEHVLDAADRLFHVPGCVGEPDRGPLRHPVADRLLRGDHGGMAAAAEVGADLGEGRLRVLAG